ncbi:helix-turn-helix domain-containing protein [Desemzia sp. RIT804]|uniref:helix-turn-helix transcriptional regulator n=1 Tax=Desemzia sp. RIT 804 TaxID=2810209 RepID=UPI0019528E23|nr:helix-turn-helix domain-containing protein [Desemzia sp. RIT 804]MBM6615813.1 helix-turn-helix domain-containing protein [Desemzia sp. RIT 804]
MKIGEKIKEGRLNKEWTQEEVAKILHVSRSTVSSWEVNRTYPDLDLLVALSDLYDISLDVILREDEQMIEDIVKETKNSKKRRRWNIILLLMFIPVTLFLGYRVWSASLVVSPNQIEDVKLKLNGNNLNSESQLLVTLNTDSFHEYSGYWMESTEDSDTITVEFYQDYSLSGKQKERIAVPIDLTHFESSQKKIENIEIKGSDSSNIKVVFNINE